MTDPIASDLIERLRLFPEAHDTLTRQEMLDAKGNWRSLIDQQTRALRELRTKAEALTREVEVLRAALKMARVAAASHRIRLEAHELALVDEALSRSSGGVGDA